jgi:predicted metal-dependent hydrolase
MEFQIVRSHRRRKTNEILIQDGIVYLRTPFSTPLTEMELLLKKKSRWIAKKVKEQRNLEITMKRTSYADNSTLPYLGKNYPLRIIPEESINSPTTGSLIRLLDNEFVVCTTKKNVKRIYEQWLFEEGFDVFNPLVEKYSKILNVLPKKILLKDLKSRWGSATFSNVINFNIHLLKAPIDVVEYVVLHELCHLIERNHSSRFWKLVSNFMNDYKNKIKWLKLNGPLIL